ncbi:MAG: hypothetical protein ABIC91_01590 [Nanoarchaeota archaeon]|nr:hypothetical protein [Nanoarchaeota archaeon]MBU1031232.1 hypothetical protein [Nanoarchaeota archaeon]MBU1849533.1 hypothetical protein [Nanoarchaeota archaeon]
MISKPFYRRRNLRNLFLYSKPAEKIKDIATCVGIASVFGFSIIVSEYLDFPGWDNKVQTGRTKNAISTIVTGLVGQKLYDKSNIDVEIKKKLFPDATVKGYTSKDTINTHVNLTLTKSNFLAGKDYFGMLEGQVKKSEFNWNVKQIDYDSYEIKRFGPKFNHQLDLMVGDISSNEETGKIIGKYIRKGPHFDWNIEGTYDRQGNVQIEIDGSLNLGINLEGKITQRF